MNIITNCNDCVFRVEDDKTNEQVGCIFGRIEKFRETNTEVKKSAGFYFIGRACNLKRTDEWLQKALNKEGDLGVLEQAALESTARIAVVIILKGDMSLDDLTVTIKSAVAQEKCIFAHLTVYINNSLLRKRVQAVVQELWPNQNWHVVKNAQAEKWDDFRVPDFIHRSLGNTAWYTVWLGGSVIPVNFALSINYALNINLERWSLLLPYEQSSINGLTVQRLMHKSATVCSLDGNIVERITELSQIEDKPYFIGKVGDVCQLTT